MRSRSSMIAVVWGGLLVTLAAGGSVWAADFSSWAMKMNICFAGYTPAETLTNLPALVQFAENSNGFHYADLCSPTNAADLRFTDATGTNELNYEVDQWNTNGTSYVWVRVPQLADSNAAIWAYYGKSGQTVPAYTTNGLTWTAGYAGVWHMKYTPPVSEFIAPKAG